MDTLKWGPGGWVFLHTIAFNYPDDAPLATKIAYRQFFNSLADMLPCRFCRESYAKFIDKYPIDDYLGSKRDMAYWLYAIHNLVNNKLRSQNDTRTDIMNTADPSFEEVCKVYRNFRAECNKTGATTCEASIPEHLPFKLKPAAQIPFKPAPTAPFNPGNSQFFSRK